MPIISILLTDKVIGLLKQFYLMTVQSKKLIFNYQAMCDYFLMNKPDILLAQRTMALKTQKMIELLKASMDRCKADSEVSMKPYGISMLVK